jgi:hypothetical protein
MNVRFQVPGTRKGTLDGRRRRFGHLGGWHLSFHHAIQLAFMQIEPKKTKRKGDFLERLCYKIN